MEPPGQSLCRPPDWDHSAQGADEIWDFNGRDLVLRTLVFSLHSCLEKCYAAEPNASAAEGVVRALISQNARGHSLQLKPFLSVR